MLPISITLLIIGSILPFSILGKFAFFTFSPYSLVSLLISSLSYPSILLFPSRTIAFSFFEPITAPRPDLAAILPLSFDIPEISDSFSAAIPIVATAHFLLSLCLFINNSSVSTASIPQRSEAS